jgi:hypothetical protein
MIGASESSTAHGYAGSPGGPHMIGVSARTNTCHIMSMSMSMSYRAHNTSIALRHHDQRLPITHDVAAVNRIERDSLRKYYVGGKEMTRDCTARCSSNLPLSRHTAVACPAETGLRSHAVDQSPPSRRAPQRPGMAGSYNA